MPSSSAAAAAAYSKVASTGWKCAGLAFVALWVLVSAQRGALFKSQDRFDGKDGCPHALSSWRKRDNPQGEDADNLGNYRKLAHKASSVRCGTYREESWLTTRVLEERSVFCLRHYQSLRHARQFSDAAFGTFFPGAISALVALHASGYNRHVRVGRAAFLGCLLLFLTATFAVMARTVIHRIEPQAEALPSETNATDGHTYVCSGAFTFRSQVTDCYLAAAALVAPLALVCALLLNISLKYTYACCVFSTAVSPEDRIRSNNAAPAVAADRVDPEALPTYTSLYGETQETYFEVHEADEAATNPSADPAHRDGDLRSEEELPNYHTAVAVLMASQEPEFDSQETQRELASLRDEDEAGEAGEAGERTPPSASHL